MPEITIRNVSTSPIHITRITTHFQGPPRPVPITAKNITNVKNVAANATNFATGIFTKVKRRVVTDPLPAPQPPQELTTKTINHHVAPYSMFTPNSDIPYPEHTSVTLDLTFNNDHAFSVVLPAHAEKNVVFPSVTRKTGEVHSLYAVFHRDKANLCLISSGGLEEWMSRLPSRLRISSLSIPGTHNSPTHHVALPSVRCQAVNIPTQLRNGIRFLDIRVQPDDALNLVHGAFPIAISGNKPLRGVIDAVYTFLEQHSRETVIVSLKREGRDVGVDDKAFSKRIYDEIISKRLDKWHLSPTIPTLGEARGKIILFRRFYPHAADIPLGIDASHWAYNTPHDIRGQLSIQDFCEVAETENIDIKLTHIKTHLERSSNVDPAMAEEQSQLLYVNFLSASNFWKVGCWPEKIAAKVNPEIEWWLARKHRLGRGTGVVVLDFVGEGDEWGICRLVTGMNGGLLK